MLAIANEAGDHTSAIEVHSAMGEVCDPSDGSRGGIEGLPVHGEVAALEGETTRVLGHRVEGFPISIEGSHGMRVHAALGNLTGDRQAALVPVDGNVNVSLEDLNTLVEGLLVIRL